MSGRMKYWNPFESAGAWLKGNLHTHSSRSDGILTPEEVAEWYAHRNYDFLAITDHRTRTRIDPPEGSALLMLPSMELDGQDRSFGGTYHITGIGLQTMDNSGNGTSLPEDIARIKADGGIAILAHPYWLGISPDEMNSMGSLDGLEVFNATCQLSNGKGDSSYLWDHVLDAGMSIYGFAVDDTHWRRQDAGQAWVMARVERCTTAGILSALKKGCFYGTQGPTIHDFSVDKNVAYARCSPVAEIRFVCQRNLGSCIRSETSLIQEAEFSLLGSEQYVRLVCIDRHGRTAWSNPIPGPAV